jgi:hypothetical protein
MRIKIAAVALASLIVATPAVAGPQTSSKRVTAAKSGQAKFLKTTKSRRAASTKASSSRPKTAPTTIAPTPSATSTTTILAAAPSPNGTFLGGCDAGLFGASACQGYYSGNILNGSPTDIPIQQSAIAALPGDFVFNGDWTALQDSTITTLINGNQLDFGTALFGETIIGAHFGNVAGEQFGNVTGFYYFNFLEPTQYITLADTQGFSTATLYTTTTTTPVPEPATWAMMLLGFGAIGYGARRRRRYGSMIPQLA